MYKPIYTYAKRRVWNKKFQLSAYLYSMQEMKYILNDKKL